MVTPSSPSDPSQRVAPGTHICLELTTEGETDTLEFDLVADADADYYAGFLGESTPLAQAILGRPSGATVRYTVAGETNGVKILSVTPSTRQPPPGRGQQREAFIQRAVKESEYKNRLAVATSMGNKWGDLDADGFAKGLIQDEDNK